MQTVDAGGVCAEDFCSVFGGEVLEVVAEGLPPVGVGRGYEADGPVGAGEESVGAEGFYDRVEVGAEGFEGPGGPCESSVTMPESLQETLGRLLSSRM